MWHSDLSVIKIKFFLLPPSPHIPMLVRKTAKGLHSILHHYYNIGMGRGFPRVLSKIVGVWGGGGGGQGHHGNYCPLSLAVPMPYQCLAPTAETLSCIPVRTYSTEPCKSKLTVSTRSSQELRIKN